MHTKLDGPWRFRVDRSGVGLDQRWFEPKLVADGWTDVFLPAPWERFGLADFEGDCWYRREFVADGDSLPRALTIVGIAPDAQVWLNGRPLANRVDAQRCFATPLDSAIRAGENVLAIRLPDSCGPACPIGLAFLHDAASADEMTGGPYAKLAARPSADWVRDAVIYEVYPRSFSDAGGFAGIERGLDGLADLGVTVLWLMPIHPVGRKAHKGSLGCPYAVSDYYAVNPEFGTLDDFRRLLDATHARGMRLIIDLVANHTGWDGPLISEHPEWYARGEDGAIRSPLADWSDVAQLDYSRRDLREYMIEMMCYWVGDIGIDGFRCDVAGMVPTDFWEAARAELDTLRAVLMLAEDDSPRQHVRAFDLTYDWRTYDSLGRAVAGRFGVGDMRDILHDESLLFPRGSLRMRFSTNHDKNAWDAPAMTRYGPALASTAAALTYALPGVPLIYNGQEVGNLRALSLFDRVAIDWSSEDYGLRRLYAELAALRRGRVSLRRGDWQLLNGAPKGVVGLLRRFEDETTAVVMNFTDQRVELDTCSLPRNGAVLMERGLLGDSALAGYGFAVFA